MRLLGLLFAFIAITTVVPIGVAAAQSTRTPAQRAADQRLREQRDELDRVRREQEDLEHQADSLRNTAHNLSDEVTNLDRRVEKSAQVVEGIDRQLFLIASEVDSASAKMVAAEHELARKRATLHQRVIDVYKRGPLFDVEALLSAHSFGELVARYKYLHELTLHDQSLVTRVAQLRDEVSGERDRLVTLQLMLGESRRDKAQEERRLRALEDQQRTNLVTVQKQTKQVTDRIERYKRQIAQMEATLAALEAAKKKADAARPAAAPRVTSSIKTSDYGKLDWPVNGPLVYTYGKSLTASNATIHWNGVGIGAAVGTPVHSVGAGKVALVKRLDTYGMTVFIDHGGGDYTIYGSLQKASVKEGQSVTKGEVIGLVGVSDPELPPHLHFEIRTGGRDAVDPAKWLAKHK